MSELIVVTCSGISNTGRLTGQAVNAFMQRHPGVFERHIPAADISDGLSSDSEVVVLEGCPDCCSFKHLNAFACIEILSSELRKAFKRL